MENWASLIYGVSFFFYNYRKADGIPKVPIWFISEASMQMEQTLNK